MMKHFIKTTLLLIVLLTSATASAHDFEVDGIYYNKNGEKATVTYKGSSYSAYSSEYSGTIVIPETVTYDGVTYTVTMINNYAFRGCKELISATIPNTVVRICYGAFNECSGLTSVEIPNSVTTLDFDAFRDCRSLTSITLPNTLKTIENSMFDGCISLTEITIPNSVTSIDSFAFARCSQLTNVAIPNSVTTIEDYAFHECSSLTDMIIPSSVTTFGYGVFSGCTKLETLTVDQGNPVYDSRNNCNAIIKTDNNKLMSGCKNTIIPNTVTEIASVAFLKCYGLTSITIGNSVTSIGYNVFNGCSGITDLIWNARNCSSMGSIPTSNIERVIIGNEVEILPNSFVSGSKISSVNIPNSVTSIGSGAFRNCSNLTSIKVETGNPKYDSRNNCNAIIKTDNNKLMSGCKNTIIPNTVTEIASVAFLKCYGLTSMTIPNSVTVIGKEAFGWCTNMTKVTLPESITVIKDETFRSCRSLKELTIPKTVTSIGANAFHECSSLESLVIPSSVTSLSNNVFAYCRNLKSIKVESDNPVYDSRDNCNAIIKTSTKTLITGCMNTVIPNSVTVIDKDAFEGSKHLTDITVPNSVTRINDGAFEYCSALTNINLPGSLTYIGETTFYGCKALTSITCLAINPPYIKVSPYCPTFDSSVYNKTTIHVPNASISKYKESGEWKRFTRYVGIMNVVPGDMNGDGRVSISDVTTLIDLLLVGGNMPDYADVNGDGIVNVSDVTFLIEMLLTMH